MTASDRPGTDAPVGWLATGGVAALGLLLIAGEGPLGPALATFGLGILVAVGLVWGYGAAMRRLARRRAAASDAVVVREGIARLRRGLEAADGTPAAELRELSVALDAIAGAADPGPPASLAALARAAAARVRPLADARDVRVVVAVDDDTRVRGAGLELALAALLRRAAGAAPGGSTVTAAIRRGRAEIRDAGARAAGDDFAAALVRALAHRAGGDVHVLDGADGTLTVLELPAAR